MQHRNELTALADYLEHFQERKPPGVIFHLKYWFVALSIIDEEDQRKNNLISADQQPYTEGYAACAIGHLSFAVPATKLHIDTTPAYHADPTCTDPTTGYHYSSFDAVATYFDLDDDTIRYLFAAERYPGRQLTDPSTVAQRLRAWLANHPEPPTHATP